MTQKLNLQIRHIILSTIFILIGTIHIQAKTNELNKTQSDSILISYLKEYGIKKLYHELPMSRKGAIKADINNGFKVVLENIEGMKKFGQVEKLVYLEKVL